MRCGSVKPHGTAPHRKQEPHREKACVFPGAADDDDDGDNSLATADIDSVVDTGVDVSAVVFCCCC